MRRILILAFILCVYTLVFSINPIFAQKRSVTVGVVIDGPWADNDLIRKTNTGNLRYHKKSIRF